MFDFSSSQLKAGQYVYLGNQEGTFVAEDGRSVPYRNIFVFNEQSNSSNRSIVGYVSQKLKVSSPDVWKGLEIGQVVYLYFDQYGRVQQVIPC